MAGKGQAEGCASCAKWLLIVFNVIFCLIGIGLVAAGVYAYIELRDYLNILGNEMINAPAIVLIAFGCITFVIAAIGCIGACKESPCLLFVFAIVIGILLVAEIAAGIAAFAYRSKIEEWFDGSAPKLMEKYKQGTKDVNTEAWDLVQKQLECCGLQGPDDWKNATIAPLQAPQVPESCTVHGKLDGCKEAVINLVKKNIILVGGVGIAFGVIELLGIVLACCLGCSVKRGTNA